MQSGYLLFTRTLPFQAVLAPPGKLDSGRRGLRTSPKFPPPLVVGEHDHDLVPLLCGLDPLERELGLEQIFVHRVLGRFRERFSRFAPAAEAEVSVFRSRVQEQTRVAAIASEEDVLCRGIGRADQARYVPRRVARSGDDEEGPVAPDVVAVLEGGDLRRRVVPREFGHVAVRLDGVDLVARLGPDNDARVREREQASRAAVVKVVV